jgi:uncharacterized protein YbjT (DUF2867 family)
VRGASEPPAEGQEIWHAYLVAKLAAEDDLRSRSLAWTIVRPGALTDDPASGLVTLAPSVARGFIARDDVAAVLVSLLDYPTTAGQVLELVSGSTPVPQAVIALP